MIKKIMLLILFCFMLSSPALVMAQIRAAGSSTVYPFITIAAEAFARSTDFKAPIIEATGTGGGFKLFCSGIGKGTTDLSNASRAIKPSEVEACAANGISKITEINIGYDGIVLANALGAIQYDLTKEHIFLALAREVSIGGELAPNPHHHWSDIDKNFPTSKIEIYGPPPTSGTRDAFVELVLEEACMDMPAFIKKVPDEKKRAKRCSLIREDGAYIEVGENDNLIVQKLASNPDALGIFGFSFLDQNGSSIQGSDIDGVEASFENIASGDYPISRPLFVYVKDAHIGKTEGLREFIQQLVGYQAIGEDGYLLDAGLIPLTEEALKQLQTTIANK